MVTKFESSTTGNSPVEDGSYARYEVMEGSKIDGHACRIMNYEYSCLQNQLPVFGSTEFCPSTAPQSLGIDFTQLVLVL